jgi:hypothetical protein
MNDRHSANADLTVVSVNCADNVAVVQVECEQQVSQRASTSPQNLLTHLLAHRK